jgi:transcriptional regulator with XRE-family HTH domain
MKIKTKFGKVIKQLRSDRGLSQEELADRAGVHRTYIGMIERAEKNITIENSYKLSKALKVPLSSIFLKIEKDG